MHARARAAPPGASHFPCVPSNRTLTFEQMTNVSERTHARAARLLYLLSTPSSSSSSAPPSTRDQHDHTTVVRTQTEADTAPLSHKKRSTRRARREHRGHDGPATVSKFKARGASKRAVRDAPKHKHKARDAGARLAARFQRLSLENGSDEREERHRARERERRRGRETTGAALRRKEILPTSRRV